MSGRIENHPLFQKVNSLLSQYEKELKLDEYPLLNKAHDQIKIPRIYLVLSAFGLFLSFLIRFLGLQFISNLVAFYPAYMSFKALQSHEKEDDAQWLTYWVVYGSLGLFESLLDVVFWWLPFYFILKMVFLFWAYSPKSKGASLIYHKVLAPAFDTFEREISDATQNRKQNQQKVN